MKADLHIGARMRIPEKEIIMMEGDVNYTHVYTRSGEVYLVATTLKLLEARMSNFYYRSHKKYIVNLKQVKSLEKYRLSLSNEKTVQVSRRRLEGLRERLEILKPSALK